MNDQKKQTQELNEEELENVSGGTSTSFSQGGMGEESSESSEEGNVQIPKSKTVQNGADGTCVQPGASTVGDADS